MEQMIFCQSCGMPLNEEVFAQDVDGSKNEDYCMYCYKDGTFTWDGTMEQMIDLCAPHMVQNMPGMTQDEAKVQMRAFFPQLKRWKGK